MLNEIVKHKRNEISSTKLKVSKTDLKSMLRDQEKSRPFSVNLKKGKPTPSTKIIAEVKKASPSKGIICHDFKPVDIAMIYEEGGAAAISCLTEKNYFLGNIDYISLIKAKVKLPVLRKDFIIDEYQIYESRAFGSDAFLLIAAILDEIQLRDFCHMGMELGMEVLVEIHSEEEVDSALNSNARMIGINNRNLSTFKTDLSTTKKLIKKIPEHLVKISESGISERRHILELEEVGTDAFLIGEALTGSKNILAELEKLIK
jgi:indole-3-glycerol phosphate synthase